MSSAADHPCAALNRRDARMWQEAGHPSEFTAQDFTDVESKRAARGIGSVFPDSQSDFSLSQHQGSAFERNETCAT